MLTSADISMMDAVADHVFDAPDGYHSETAIYLATMIRDLVCEVRRLTEELGKRADAAKVAPVAQVAGEMASAVLAEIGS